MDWMNAVIQGVLLGGLYALCAAGLSLVFGIMRVVNLAHGDFIILAAFLSVVVVGVTGLGPFLSLVIVVPLMGGLGYAVQRGLLARTLDRGVLPPLLVTLSLGHHPEPPAADLLGRRPAPGRGWHLHRQHRHRRAARHRVVSCGRLRRRYAGDRGATNSLHADVARPRVPGDGRRPGDRASHGYRQPSHLRAGGRDRVRDRRPRRSVPRDPDDVLSGHRSGPPPRRVRDGRHRWSRIAVGNADGRRHSRDCAHDRCQARSRLPRADRASRVPAGAARAAAGPVREASERDVTAAGYTIERGTTASRLGARAGAVLVAALVALPFWGSSGDMRLMVEFLSMLTLAQMWNLLAGYGGLMSVGQQAYVGLGGYALIVLADFLEVNPFVSVFLAGFVTAAFALPTAAVVFRFQGGYFAVGTWVVAEVYYLLVANSSALGGGLGRSLQAIRGIARAERERLTYWVALVVGVGAVALVYVLLRSDRKSTRLNSSH